MYGSLFIKTKAGQSLDAFAKECFSALKLHGVQMRQSDNEPSGEYAVASCLGLGVTIRKADDTDFTGYAFHLSLSPDEVWLDDPGFLEGLADLIARDLTRQGFVVVRALDIDSPGGARMTYELDESAPSIRDQVRVRIERR